LAVGIFSGNYSCFLLGVFWVYGEGNIERN
jgi:hypothetical protein